MNTDLAVDSDADERVVFSEEKNGRALSSGICNCQACESPIVLFWAVRIQDLIFWLLRVHLVGRRAPRLLIYCFALRKNIHDHIEQKFWALEVLLGVRMGSETVCITAGTVADNVRACRGHSLQEWSTLFRDILSQWAGTKSLSRQTFEARDHNENCVWFEMKLCGNTTFGGAADAVMRMFHSRGSIS